MAPYPRHRTPTELTRSYYHRNELGSVMEITDALEQTVVSYRYDPYGQVTITRNGQTQSSDPLGQYWTFTGRFHDEESGLYHYRARAYDPDSGRFFQRDRLGYAVDPNLMQYVGSSPSTLIDPSGNRPDTSPRACDATLSLPVDTGPAHSWSSPEGKRLRTRLRMSNWGRDSLVKMRLLPALEDAQKSVEVWEGLKDKMLDRDPNRAGQTSDGGDPVMSIRQVDRWIRRAKAVRTPIELLLGRSWAKGPPSLEDAENAQEAAEAMLDQAILFNSLINPWGTRDPAADDKGS